MLITRCNCRGLFSHTQMTATTTKNARGGGNGRQVATIKYAFQIQRQAGKIKKQTDTLTHTLTHRESILIYAVLVRRTSNCNLGQAYCLQIINIHMHLNGLVCVPEANISLSNAAFAALSLFLFRLCFWLGNAKELSITTFLSPPRTPTHPI